VKVAVVVQRYGADINGGAELHARYIAEHLARHAEVEVLTTCARDYVTWRNELPAAVEQINGVAVRRFPVARPRDVHDFGRRSNAVFTRTHSLSDELSWLESEGPTSPALVKYVTSSADRYDWFVFFSYRYYHAFHGVRAVASRAVLVPTAERDAAIGLAIFPPIFRGVRALMFNSFEERAMIQHVANVGELPGVVVGVGSDIPARPEPARFRQQFGIEGRFAIYVGRIDENKGCKELFAYFQRYTRTMPGRLQLVLIGKSLLPVPDDPRIRHLGFLSDPEKFDAIAAADVLIMPSYYESLSMVALEAWGMGKPVLANGRCDVLKGQSLRSNAGLYYESYAEFADALYSITSSAALCEGLGRNGARYFQQHYSWPVIERKYLEVFTQLSEEQRDRGGREGRADREESRIEPLPGFFARRARTVPPAEEVLAGVPAGAVTS
jgi:glycosyltransferase involved in cell wall biosynthesis